MTTSPLNNLSTDYWESTLATSGNSSKASAQNSLSTFAQLLGTSASSATSATATSSSSKTNGPNEMLEQMMTSFKANGLQSQASAFDPMSIG